MVRRFRPNSAAICRWLLPRLASNWIALRSICRNILPPVTRRGSTTAAASMVHFYFATAAHITFAVYKGRTEKDWQQHLAGRLLHLLYPL